MSNIDKLKIRMGRDIELSKKHNIKIRQPKVSEIVDMGEEEFQKHVVPFIITTEAIFNGAENEEELIQSVNIFELFFMEVSDEKYLLDDTLFDGRNSLEFLIESLHLFMEFDNAQVLKNRKKIVIDDTYIIDNNEFSKIRRIIQQILDRKEVEVEKPPKNMTKRKKDIWLKLQEGRRRKAEREAIYLQDLINFIEFGGRSHISTDVIENMTYYQLQNAYKSIVSVDSYSTGILYKISPKFDVKDDNKHWTETIKIGK